MIKLFPSLDGESTPRSSITLAPPFNIDFRKPEVGYCGRNFKKLPKDWREKMAYKYSKANQSNAWRDFNCAAKAREAFIKGSKPLGHGIFCAEDIPEFPDPADYADLTKEGKCS